MPASVTELYDMVSKIKSSLIDHATGSGTWDHEEYHPLRAQLMNEPHVKALLPEVVKGCRDLGEFWQFIKARFPTYQERREYLRAEFDPVLTMLEEQSLWSPGDVFTATLAIVDWEHVQEAWQKALERRSTDPDGAITAARTLIEAVCKHILGESGILYDDTADLPKLYAMAAEQMSLAPSQHTELLFKQILGNAQQVVQRLGELRNAHGDAHGQGKGRIKPRPRHAELAVNLAGSISTFLIATWQERQAAPVAADDASARLGAPLDASGVL